MKDQNKRPEYSLDMYKEIKMSKGKERGVAVVLYTFVWNSDMRH